MLDSHHVKRMRKDRDDFETLRGFSHIQLTITNLTINDVIVNILGNVKRNKIKYEGIEIKNLTAGYTEDDNSLTMLKNYINSVGYIEVVMYRLMSTNVSQITKPFTIYQEVSEGTLNPRMNADNIWTQNYFNSNQFYSGILDIPRKDKIFNSTTLSFNILANTAFIVTMFCGKNKGEVKSKVKSFYDNFQDDLEAYGKDDFEHYVPSMSKNKRRTLILKK